jgi:hypothetical protein
VLFGGVLGVLDGVQFVAVREMGMMARLLVIAGLGVRRRLAMVLGRVLVVLRGFVVMVMNLMLGHVPVSLADVFVNPQNGDSNLFLPDDRSMYAGAVTPASRDRHVALVDWNVRSGSKTGRTT